MTHFIGSPLLLGVSVRVKNQFWIQRIVGFRKLGPVLGYAKSLNNDGIMKFQR
jgi:hypothetical protein